MTDQLTLDLDAAGPVDAAESGDGRKAPDAPLEYELRVSRRARRVTLRVEPARGLVVTIPARFPRRDVPATIEPHRAWALETLAAAEAALPLACREWPPRRLELAALDLRALIVFDGTGAAPSAASLVDATECVLPLEAAPEDRVGVAGEVARWLKPLAKAHLAPKLAALAARHGLQYRRCSVRGQRSVWGSYSSSGTLSLNYKLLFLSPALVDYVLLHELAHTRHLDHSPSFWRLLDGLSPGARAHDAALRKAGQRVPPWLELAR